MTVTYYRNDLKIEVYDDSAYNSESPDSLTSYEKVYQPDDNSEYVTHSQHAIAVYKADEKIFSAILLGSSGATTVAHDAVVIDGESLIIRCSNNIFSLTLPDLQLNWMQEVDWATCFSIFSYKNTYITHGELSVCRLDKTGKILWEYGGADIFVTLNGTSAFEMRPDHILLKDFNGDEYKIDYNGNTIWSSIKSHKR